MKLQAALASTRETTARLNAAATVAASGSRINASSDDPTGFATTARVDARLSILSARKTTANRSGDDLDLAETTLASASDLMVRIREIGLAMSNGAIDAQTRANAADEVDGIKKQLLGLANTRGATGFLFGGSRTQLDPFDANGVFLGDDDKRMVELSDSITLRANASGADAFTAAGGLDAFASLTAFATALRTNNLAGIQQGATDGDALQKQITRARIDAGSRASELHAAADVMDETTLALQKTRAQVSDADVADAYTKLTAARNDYERALEIARTLMQLGGMKGG